MRYFKISFLIFLLSVSIQNIHSHDGNPHVTPGKSKADSQEACVEPTDVMRKEIENTNFQEVKKILISNVTANEVSNKEELKKLLVSQIENRVRWRESITNMISKGVNHFIEIGPGKVLSSLVKRIDKSVKINTINSESDIKDLVI